CLYNEDVIRTFYNVVVECLQMEKEKLHYGVFGHYPSAVLHQSLSFTQFLMTYLQKIKIIAQENIHHVESPGMNTFIITGANQGGKSTFLRSIGLAQIMRQTGMLVSAECYSADLCRQIFTHYK